MVGKLINFSFIHVFAGECTLVVLSVLCSGLYAWKSARLIPGIHERVNSSIFLFISF